MENGSGGRGGNKAEDVGRAPLCTSWHFNASPRPVLGVCMALARVAWGARLRLCVLVWY